MTARGVSVVSHAAAMIVAERHKRQRARSTSTEAEEDNSYEKLLRDFIENKGQRPARNPRQENLFKMFSQSES